MVGVLFRKKYKSREPPEKAIRPGPDITVVAFQGADFAGLRPALAVREGDTVRIGDVLFRDRRRPEIAFVSPVSGTIGTIELGARHCLSMLKVHADKNRQGNDPPPTSPPSGDPRETLLDRGFWPAFRTRPFARIPEPSARPDAIFVSALPTSPSALEPRIVIQSHPNQFQRGIEILTKLTHGPVHICQSSGPISMSDAGDRVLTTTFSDQRWASKIGTCIHKLFPAKTGREIWTIDCQDVIAIGHLFETGNYFSERIISLKYPHEQHPRLLKTILGASIADLVANYQVSFAPETAIKILSGSPQSGREATFVGRYHQQVTVIDTPKRPTKPSLHSIMTKSRSSRKFNPIVAVTALDSVLPFDIPAVPLMRALSICDVELAEKLGCLELIEEDVAPLSQICSSGADYGSLLRRVLDELELVK